MCFITLTEEIFSNTRIPIQYTRYIRRCIIITIMAVMVTVMMMMIDDDNDDDDNNISVLHL